MRLIALYVHRIISALMLGNHTVALKSFPNDRNTRDVAVAVEYHNIDRHSGEQLFESRVFRLEKPAVSFGTFFSEAFEASGHIAVFHNGGVHTAYPLHAFDFGV